MLSSILQASETELIWTMRLSVVVFAALSTLLSLTVNSIYLLFVLCGDFVYVILFPQFFCVIHVPVSNAYGSLTGFVFGYIIRFAAGEPAMNIPALIKYPLFEVIDGVPTQLFPFRTLTMVISLCTIILVSFLTDVAFRRGYLDKKWDVFKCFVSTSEPTDDKKTDSKKIENKYGEGNDSDTKIGGNLNPGFGAKDSDLDTPL